MRALDDFLHLCLPRVCSLCVEPLQNRHERTARLCPACRRALPGAGAGRCMRCALRHFPRDDTGSACALDQTQHFPWHAALAWADYDYPVDGWIHALKFGGESSLAEGLGQGLAAAVQAAPSGFREAIQSLDAIIPLPLSRERLARRGYNQSELIARAFVRAGTSLTIDNRSLLRVRHGPALSRLPSEGRHARVAGAYAVARPQKGRRLGLLDDVMTTGASLAEATRTLLQAGATEVIVLVATRTP